MAVPLIQAASCRRRGVMWIEGEQYQFLAFRCLDLPDCLCRKRMPITHRYKASSVQPEALQLRLQSLGLTLRKSSNWGATTYHRVVMLNFLSAGSGNELR